MNGAFQYLDIILFASIAIFLIVRLVGVLGRRTGHEQGGRRRPQTFPVRRDAADKAGDGADNVIALPDREPNRPVIEPGSPAADDLNRIVAVDSSFNPDSFLAGARGAFEMIVAAFASGDNDVLSGLLSPSVRADFSAAIAARREANQTQDTTLIGIKSASIVSAALSDGEAQVTVRFVSEQVNAIKDSEGRIVDGDPNLVADVTDIWTFSRRVDSREPNWHLSATGAPLS